MDSTEAKTAIDRLQLKPSKRVGIVDISVFIVGLAAPSGGSMTRPRHEPRPPS